MNDSVEIYHFKEGWEWIPIFFNNNKEIGILWNKLCQKLLLENRFPHRIDYENFIKENTPKYFKPHD